MNTDDPIFVDLALKAIAGKASITELAQLQELLRQPELASEYKQMQADADFAREVLPALGDDPKSVPPLTDFEKSQMRKLADARQARLASEANQPKKSFWNWQWVLGLATATAVIAILVIVNLPAQPRMVQVAMLDSMGSMRGTNDINRILLPALQFSFGQTNVANYADASDLKVWFNNWTDSRAVKIVYDRDNGEVRVTYKDVQGQIISKIFPVHNEAELPAVLQQAKASIK